MFVALIASIALTQPAPIRRGIPGYPRIAKPADAAQRRINHRLTLSETSTRRVARACLDDSTNPTSWQRTIRVTMRGPVFLSYAVEDEVDCGGAHPSTEHSAVTFDLATGEPVDWPRLLGRLRARLGPMPSDDMVGVVLDSKRLSALYAQRYDRALTAAGGIPECLGWTKAGAGPFRATMVPWLDARAGGLVLQFDGGNAEKACSLPVVIPTAVLRREGASARLVTALTTARGR